ncbi:MAG: serine/threonine-protein kinase [Kofleriaceae bacterium]|nr:serine/threonine-protein kinase [Kofleriaceae bacterium]
MTKPPERYGTYTVHEQLGKGGMATVHRADRQLKNGGTQQVALKRLNPTQQKELVALFLDEARVLKLIKHPNIAETYDSGRVFGTYFIAMEYVPGPTLQDLVRHAAKTVGPLPQAVTLNLAIQLCDALEYVHNLCDEKGVPLGIVHRDVTPANILLAETGLLKLIDFGFAKAATSSEHTEKGVIKGKFGYVAPEYLAGELPDHRADLWAVGIILYELLTSRRLFDGADAYETTMRVRTMPIPRPSLANPRVIPELDAIVRKALERDPAKRWQSAADMRAALVHAGSELGVVIDDKTLAMWVEWAMRQDPGDEVSGVGYLHELLGTPRPKLKHVFLQTEEPPLPVAPPSPAIVALPEPPLISERNRNLAMILFGVVLVLVLIVLIAN